MKFTKSFTFIFKAIWSKGTELLISLGMVIFLLLLASSIMFFIEHHAQPEAFSSIWATMWWGVATLTTVGYGDIYPITVGGKILGGILAVLGVGLFALPAGIIASGFVEEIEKDKELKMLKKLEEQLLYAFSIEYFVPVKNAKKALGLSHIPRKWLSLNDIKYKMGVSEEDVLKVVNYSKLFRLRNVKLAGEDKAGLEYINANRSYGQCINRNSNLTIINLYASIQPYYGHFSMIMADILGANYISNEFFSKISLLKDKQLNLISNPDYHQQHKIDPILAELKKDILKLVGPNQYCIFMVNSASTGPLLQFNIGGELGTESFETGIFFKDLNKLNEAYQKAQDMAESYEMDIVQHQKMGKPEEDHATHFIHKQTNANLLMLHMNVSVLKKKLKTYYQHAVEIADCFEGFK